MEDQRTEIEFDEFEKLLGEIPKATSGNPHAEEGGFKSVSLKCGLSPICVNSSKGPLTEKLHSNGRYDDWKLLLSKTNESPIKRVQIEDPNLLVDQSLTSTFSELSFKSVSPSANCKSSPNYSVLLDCNYAASIKNLGASRNSPPTLAVPSFQSHNTPCVFNECNVTKAAHDSSNISKFDGQEQKKMPIGYYQARPLENFSTTLPLAHGRQGFQYLPDVAVSDFEFPMISDQQRGFSDIRSRLPYFHSLHLKQPHMSWRNIEEEQYYRIHHQCLYLQQLRNQRLEDQHPIQTNGTVATTLGRQPYVEMPIFQRLQQSNQASFCNNYEITRSSNLSPSATQIFEKVAKQNLPQKILTRSHGLNPLKEMKFGSVGGNEPLAHFNHDGKDLSNGHLRVGLSNPTAGCFQADHLASWNFFPDVSDIKGANLRPQSQKYNSVDDFTGRIYLLAKDQHGCRFLQRKFSEGAPEDAEKIFFEIIDHIVELMTDPFGNYLVQKLLEVCGENQQMQILHAITEKHGELVRISCDMHGTRAVQKVIETLKTPEQFSMVVNSLKPGIVTMIKNMNGNHVVQRCLQYLLPEYREFLFDAAIANCLELATDRHGCCILQKCLSHSEGEQQRRLVREITSNALLLSQDPFGNYVVQYVLEQQLGWGMREIVDGLEGKFGELSMQKYSSNVVEKCLKYGGEEGGRRIIKELMSNGGLEEIMQDAYGNYVIQAALSEAKGSIHGALVEAIRPHIGVLRTCPYGKKVLWRNSLKK